MDEPLRENAVGAFGELSARPNPDGLVVLTVPPFEAMLPFLAHSAGRELTPEEIETERQSAPAIAVRKEVAEKMRAGRTDPPKAARRRPRTLDASDLAA